MTVTTSKQAEQGAPAARAPVDPTKLQAFLGQVVGDFGAIVGAAAAAIGDELGLYKAMADGEPMTPASLAQCTGTDERYVREWLLNQAAGGYVAYDAATNTYVLPPEQALALANEESPAYVAGGFKLLLAAAKAAPRVAQAFRTGGGLSWEAHDPDLFDGTERFFRPGYVATLVSSWIPALDGVEAKLEAGATVADVGCGHGETTILMAQAYPGSRFFGFDTHARSIERARRAAADAEVTDRVVFEVADAADFPGSGYDLVAYFDAFHDLGDPVAAARHACERLAADGTLLLVEPPAAETIEGNLNPLGRLFAGGSLLICVPHALATGQMALGNQATERQLRELLTTAGFARLRRATETHFNRVFEARR
jgi:SAM-dependent methyltransferase